METSLALTGKRAVGSALWSATGTVRRPTPLALTGRGHGTSVSPAHPELGQAKPSLVRVHSEQVRRRERRRQPVGAPTYLITTSRQDRMISELEAVLVEAGWSRNGRNPQVVLIDGRGGVDPASIRHTGSHRLLLVGPGDDPTPLIESAAVDDVHYLDDQRDLRIRLDLAVRALVDRRRAASSLACARRRAELDKLTGLGNRRAIDRAVPTALRRVGRGTPGALLMIDVDRFGLYNNKHGHVAGDEVLRALGATLASAMRQTDCAYRYGGEEFLVLLSGVNEVEASHAAERIRAAVAARAIEHLDNEPGCVTISIGLVALPAGTWLDGDEAKELADGALRAAKRDGRNRVCAASVSEPAAQSLSA